MSLRAFCSSLWSRDRHYHTNTHTVVDGVDSLRKRRRLADATAALAAQRVVRQAVSPDTHTGPVVSNVGATVVTASMGPGPAVPNATAADDDDDGMKNEKSNAGVELDDWWTVDPSVADMPRRRRKQCRPRPPLHPSYVFPPKIMAAKHINSASAASAVATAPTACTTIGSADAVEPKRAVISTADAAEVEDWLRRCDAVVHPIVHQWVEAGHLRTVHVRLDLGGRATDDRQEAFAKTLCAFPSRCRSLRVCGLDSAGAIVQAFHRRAESIISGAVDTSAVALNELCELDLGGNFRLSFSESVAQELLPLLAADDRPLRLALDRLVVVRLPCTEQDFPVAEAMGLAAVQVVAHNRRLRVLDLTGIRFERETVARLADELEHNHHLLYVGRLFWARGAVGARIEALLDRNRAEYRWGVWVKNIVLRRNLLTRPLLKKDGDARDRHQLGDALLHDICRFLFEHYSMLSYDLHREHVVRLPHESAVQMWAADRAREAEASAKAAADQHQADLKQRTALTRQTAVERLEANLRRLEAASLKREEHRRRRDMEAADARLAADLAKQQNRSPSRNATANDDWMDDDLRRTMVNSLADDFDLALALSASEPPNPPQGAGS